MGRHNLELLTAEGGSEPILFLEPSCYSMFAEDYLELKLPGAAEVKARCFLFEEFVENLLAREPGAIAFNAKPETIAIHAHCHAKALLNPAFMKRLVASMPGRTATLLGDRLLRHGRSIRRDWRANTNFPSKLRNPCSPKSPPSQPTP